MSEQVSLFEMFPEQTNGFAPIKSNDWKWSFKDYPKEKNGLKVFSCFACGGGSTMGYKLAGCEVLGCCELDPKMNEVYVRNHHPKYNFLMDIRDFNNLELPEELYHLDILDGSPPCTTFSMAGQREESWGVEKKFREGQKCQTLDDLSFVFIETVNKLKPKVVIMENVEGLLLGEAWNYVKKIHDKLKECGYKTHHWLLKGEDMGVPQTRHRVFFISIREDLGINPQDLDMTFNYAPIPYKEIKDGSLTPLGQGTKFREIAEQSIESDRSIADTRIRLGLKGSAFQTYYIRPDEIMPTLRSKPDVIDLNGIGYISLETIRNSQTFPQDYDFYPNTKNHAAYVCGMSVPPLMMKRVVERVIQGVFK